MKKIGLVLTVLALFCACQTQEQPVSPAPETREDETCSSESGFVEGEMIVEFSESMAALVESDFSSGDFLRTKSSDMNGLFSELGVTSVERLYPDAGEWEPRHRAFGLHRWYIVRYANELPQTRAMDGLSLIDGVESVERPRKVRSTSFFNDPRQTKQWNLYNDGRLASNYVAGCDIDVLPVWANFTAGSSDVIVAVVDGGIDLTHEDLSAVAIAGGPNGSRNFVDKSYDIVAHEHGTHVAGIIGAVNNNAKGVCSVAGGSDGQGGVRLLSCQVFRKDPVTGRDVTGNIADAIVWGADHGAVISQNSWGYVYDTKEEAALGGVGYVRSAIDYFIENAGFDINGRQTGPMAGGIVIFAAGNEGWPDAWPAEYDRVVAVGAINGAFRRSYYSNYGDWVDICAPGGDTKTGHLILSTIPGSYDSMQGTSMACPHVSGIAALLVSHFGGPGFTCDMLKSRLLNGVARGVVDSSSKIGDLASACAAFTYSSTQAPAAVADFSAEGNANNIDLSFTVPADPDDRSPYMVRIVYSEEPGALDGIDLFAPPATVKFKDVKLNEVKAGDMFRYTVAGLEFNTDYQVAAGSRDYAGNYSPLSEIKTVQTGENHPPIVHTDYSGDFKVKAHETLNVKYSITEPDGHAIRFNFTAGSKAATLEKTSDGYYTLRIVGNADEPGCYTASCTVSDSFGASVDFSAEYEILPNHAPVVVKAMEDMFFGEVYVKTTVSMDEFVSDPDGETLKYKVEVSDNTILKANSLAGGTLVLTPLKFGAVDVHVVGTDACGLSCEFDFKVLVRDPQSPADIYPDPVVPAKDGSSPLYVSGGLEDEVYVKIVSAAGHTVFEGTETAGAFKPFVVDMAALPAGRYKVTAVIDGRTTVKSIVKL